MSDVPQSREERVAELAEWLRERPVVRDLVLAWPPFCKVTSREDAPLVVPAPGVHGVVVSYYENGLVGVEAPMARTMRSPITGNTAHRGEVIHGECDPTRLVLVACDERYPVDVVREALSALEPES